MKKILLYLILLITFSCKEKVESAESSKQPQIVYEVDSVALLRITQERDSLLGVISTYESYLDSFKFITRDAKCVLDVARREIGIREDGGNNKGSRVEQYLKAVGLGGGFAYCAAYVCWTLEQCDVEHPRSAWSPTTARYKVIYDRTKDKELPHIDDRGIYVFGLWYNNLNRIGHTGFIESEKDDKYYFTIEGNTNGQGSREGDGVHRKWRPKWGMYVISDYTK